MLYSAAHSDLLSKAREHLAVPIIPVVTLSLTISLLFHGKQKAMLNFNVWISHPPEENSHNQSLDNILMPGLSDCRTRKFKRNSGRLLHTQEDSQSLMLTMNHTSQIHWDTSIFPVRQYILNFSKYRCHASIEFCLL